MSSKRQTWSRRGVPGAARAIAGGVLLCVAGVSPAGAADTCASLMQWNQFALDATVAAGQGALPQIRSMAIVHASIHDAVNAITGQFETYASVEPPLPGASADAAVIAAAHHALTSLFPSQSSALDEKRAASLTGCALAETDTGIAVGEAAAGEIFGLRFNDGAVPKYPPDPYEAPGAGLPGVWVPVGNAPVVAPWWRDVIPWVLKSGSQFRPDPPYGLDTEGYARDYNEVYALGRVDSSERTEDQTQIAIFWDASPSAIWNAVARRVIEARALDLPDAARTFALMYVAAADASIACWDAKYTYNFWRPITAISRADEDGNDLTMPDTTWTPLIVTHQHPEYPSGHSTNSGAMAMVLRLLFDDDPGMTITATSPRNPSFLRQWKTFSEGVREVIDARVYVGFHFRTSNETGARLGRQVAQFVSRHAFRKTR